MIDPKELRIGNLIQEAGIDFDMDGMPFSDPSEMIERIVDLRILGQIVNFSYSLNYKDPHGVYHPIPITPAWLERLGFEWVANDEKDLYQITHGGRVSIALFSYNYTEWSTMIELNVGLGFGSINQNPPESVHQLQNLYFALTGSELTITEKATT